MRAASSSSSSSSSTALALVRSRSLSLLVSTTMATTLKGRELLVWRREREREREREPLLSAADSPAPPRRPVPACPFRPPSPNPHSRVATRSLPTSPTTRPGERAKEWGGGAARPFMSSRRINAQLGYWHAFYAASGSIV